MNTIKGDLKPSFEKIGYTTGLKGDPIQYLEIKSIIQDPSVSIVSFL